MAWSPRGSRLISGGDDALVHVWDARTGRQIRILRGHAETVRAVGWSPDGSWLVSCGDDGLLLLWSDSDAAPKTYLQLDALHAVAWTNAGIAVGGVGGTLVLDVE